MLSLSFRFGFGCVVILQTTIDAHCQRRAEREGESQRGFSAAPSCTVSDSCCLIPDGESVRRAKTPRRSRGALDESAGPLIAERSARSL